VIEGRGYESDGQVGFSAFGVISYDPAGKTYSMHSYAQGFHGDFVIAPTADGHIWKIPPGPTTIRYTRSSREASGERSLIGSFLAAQPFASSKWILFGLVTPTGQAEAQSPRSNSGERGPFLKPLAV